MAVIRQTDWLDGEWWANVPKVAELFFAAVVDPATKGKCVMCRAEQPDDMKWPAYLIELEHKVTGESSEIEYRACHQCEPQLDEIMRMLGATPALRRT